MASIESLPDEILLKIFSYYMETETQSDFINKISHVCQAWEEVCMDSSLWHTFDGTLPIRYLKKICKQGFLKNAEIFKFCYFKRNTLSKDDLQCIYGNLPRLKSINFSKICWKLNKKECRFFIELIDYCPDLCEIILQDKCLKYTPSIDYKSLEKFLRIRGSKFVSLDFSNTAISNLKELFITIASACPNLEELRARTMCNIYGDHFPIVCMQKGLKKLKFLELGEEIKTEIEIPESTDGFTSLETFIYQCRRDPSLTKSRFKKLLMKSPRLKLLDISGCTRVSDDDLCCLLAENLEELYVSNTKVYESTGFIQVLQKWGKSLIGLDASNMKENYINSLFSSLISHSYLQNSEILYLHNTAVTITTVKLIIQNCSKLNLLDLERCRYIGRGRKLVYYGETKIRELLNLDT